MRKSETRETDVFVVEVGHVRVGKVRAIHANVTRTQVVQAKSREALTTSGGALGSCE